MAVPGIHVLHSIEFPAGTRITSLNSGQLNNVINELIAHPSGHPMPHHVGIMDLKPEITFETPQIQSLLAVTGVSGATQAAGNTDLMFKHATDLGTRVANATTTHRRFRASQAYVYWRSIRAQQSQLAIADARMCLSWDGSNLPLIAAGSAIATGSVAPDLFTLGPVYINGSQVSGVTEITLESGVQMFEEMSDGEHFNTFIGVKEHNPIALTIKTRDATQWGTYGISGAALSSGCDLYLRKKTPDGITYADAAAQHMKIELDYGYVMMPGAQGGGNEPVSNELRLLFRVNSDTGAPMTITASSAIA